MRTKALRALGQIVTSDPTILATVRNLLHTDTTPLILWE